MCRKKKVRELLLLGKANVIEDRGWESALGDTHHKIPRPKKNKNPCDPNCAESSEMSPHISRSVDLFYWFSPPSQKSLKAATDFAISSCCVPSPQKERARERETAKNREEIQCAHNESRRTFCVCTWHSPPRTRNIHSRNIHSWNIQSFHSFTEYSFIEYSSAPFIHGLFIRSIHSWNIHPLPTFTEYSFVPFVHGIFTRSIHSWNIHSLHSFTEYSSVPFIHAIFIHSIHSIHAIFIRSNHSIHPISCPHFCLFLCTQRRSESESAPFTSPVGGDECGWMVADFSLVPIHPSATHICLIFFDFFIFFPQRCLSLEFIFLIFSSLNLITPTCLPQA